MVKVITFLTGLLALLPAILHAEFNYPMYPEQVAPNVYAIITPTRALPNPQNGGWNSNSAFVITDDDVLLFDSGSSLGIGQAIKRAIASVTDKPVRWIVNSHAHGDHWLGNGAFTDTVETIYASDTVTSLIQNDGERWIDSFNRMSGGITGDSPVVVPTQVVGEQQSLTLGNTRFEFLLSGGSHSPGDVMLWLPDAKVLLAGDVLYSDRMPSTNAGKLRQWISTLEHLRQLHPQVVVPGHGAVSDCEGLQRLQGLLSALWSAVEQGVDDGMSDYEMLPLVSQALADFKPFYPGLEDKLKRDISHVFLQVEAASFE
jgi:glyoxylase-like metal-dependent hydrolase (beta-lactamase superfamily II)